jgi:hypothetical protein
VVKVSGSQESGNGSFSSYDEREGPNDNFRLDRPRKVKCKSKRKKKFYRWAESDVGGRAVRTKLAPVGFSEPILSFERLKV